MLLLSKYSATHRRRSRRRIKWRVRCGHGSSQDTVGTRENDGQEEGDTLCLCRWKPGIPRWNFGDGGEEGEGLVFHRICGERRYHDTPWTFVRCNRPRTGNGGSWRQSQDGGLIIIVLWYGSGEMTLSTGTKKQKATKILCNFARVGKKNNSKNNFARVGKKTIRKTISLALEKKQFEKQAAPEHQYGTNGASRPWLSMRIVNLISMQKQRTIRGSGKTLEKMADHSITLSKSFIKWKWKIQAEKIHFAFELFAVSGVVVRYGLVGHNELWLNVRVSKSSSAYFGQSNNKVQTFIHTFK